MHEHPRCCRVCSESKPLAAFAPRQERRDGIDTICRACARERRRRAYVANRETERKRGNERQREWRAANPEAHRESVKAWVRDNPEASRDQKRRMQKRRQESGQPKRTSYRGMAERLILLEQYDSACGICGEDLDPLNFTVDHIIPIARGGLHEMANLQPAHALCNNRKYTSIEGEA
jgi:5-methylcytosine-specific restriction endonuclease McrA